MDRIIIEGFCDGWTRKSHETNEEVTTVHNPRFCNEILLLCPQCLIDFHSDYPPDKWIKSKAITDKRVFV